MQPCKDHELDQQPLTLLTRVPPAVLALAGMSLQAIKMIFEFLPRSYHNGAQDPVAREKMHNAATIAGVSS